MNANISEPDLDHIWRGVWTRLTPLMQDELNKFLGVVSDAVAYEVTRGNPCKYVYGVYSRRDITLFRKDLSELSVPAIRGVMVHELGHAFCHLKSTAPDPCGVSIGNSCCPMSRVTSSLANLPNEMFFRANEQGANLVATAWGFSQELWSLEHERKLPEGL